MSKSILSRLMPSTSGDLDPSLRLLTRVVAWLIEGNPDNNVDVLQTLVSDSMSDKDKIATLLTTTATFAMFMSLEMSGTQTTLNEALAIVLGSQNTAEVIAAASEGRDAPLSKEEIRAVFTQLAIEQGHDPEKAVRTIEVEDLVGPVVEAGDEVDALDFEVWSQQSGLN